MNAPLRQHYSNWCTYIEICYTYHYEHHDEITIVVVILDYIRNCLTTEFIWGICFYALLVWSNSVFQINVLVATRTHSCMWVRLPYLSFRTTVSVQSLLVGSRSFAFYSLYGGRQPCDVPTNYTVLFICPNG